VTHALWVDQATDNYGHGSDGRGGGWPGLRQVVHVRTTRETLQADPTMAIEDHYYVTSLSPQKSQGEPLALLTVARRHWEIENRLHHTKDRSLAEDADRTRQGATCLARLRSLAVGILEHLPGLSTPQKQIEVSANPDIALRILKRKRWPRTTS